MTCTVGYLHIAVAEAIAGHVPSAEFGCGIDRIGLLGDIEGEWLASRAAGTGNHPLVGGKMLSGELVNAFLSNDVL